MNASLVCNMEVFTPAERKAHILTTTRLMESVQSGQERENGYEFLFPNETELIAAIAEFISKEQLCCPFLEFTLYIPPQPELISLSLSGPSGTQEFLRLEFNGAIP
ncbi:MAG TPA: hypothetical protein VK900_03935 [Anaerolineales bacterium]|nr:hypothetical protein [Anaerolineales bacterium]